MSNHSTIEAQSNLKMTRYFLQWVSTGFKNQNLNLEIHECFKQSNHRISTKWCHKLDDSKLWFLKDKTNFQNQKTFTALNQQRLMKNTKHMSIQNLMSSKILALSRLEIFPQTIYPQNQDHQCQLNLIPQP